MQPCHSHKKGKAGLGLGTLVTVRPDAADDDEAEAEDVVVGVDEAVTTVVHVVVVTPEGVEVTAVEEEGGELGAEEFPLTWPFNIGTTGRDTGDVDEFWGDVDEDEVGTGSMVPTTT